MRPTLKAWLLALAFALPALAATVAGVNMEDTASVAGQTLTLNDQPYRNRLYPACG